jgi:hypothetical protein
MDGSLQRQPYLIAPVYALGSAAWFQIRVFRFAGRENLHPLKTSNCPIHGGNDFC